MKDYQKKLLAFFSLAVLFLLASFIISRLDLPSILGLASSVPARPALYWQLNELSGTTATDNSGNNNSGIYGASTAAPTVQNQTLCVSQQCLWFDGVNDFVSRSYSSDTELNPGTGNLTVSAWFRHSPNITGTDVLLSRADAVNGVGYKMYMNSSGNMCFGFDTTAGSFPSDELCTTETYNNSQWNYIEVVKTGTSSVAIYMNGELAASDNTISSGSISGTNTPFYLGIDADGTSNPWHGSIDEIKVTLDAYSADEARRSYEDVGAPRPAGAQVGSANTPRTIVSDGLIAWWKLDEVGAGTRFDSSGNGNDLTDTNNVGSDTGIYNNGLSINGGSSENLFRNDADIVGLQLGNSFTITTWIRFENYSSITDGQVPIFRKGNASTSDMSYMLSLQGTSSANSRLVGSISTNGTSYDQVHTATTPLSLNTWYYVTWTYDGSTSRIYVDSTEVGSASLSGTPFNDTAPFYIGDTVDDYLSADMDEARIYSRALSTEEVTHLNQWSPPPLALYDFNDGRGLTIFDKSGNGFDATIANDSTAPRWTDGKVGQAIDLDGVDDVASLGDPEGLRLSGPMTVSTWVYVDVINNGRIIAKQGGSGVRSWSINTESSSSLYRFTIASNGSTSHSVDSSTQIQTGRWVHITGVFEPSSRLSIYVNGVLDNSSTTSIPASQYTANGLPTLIGARNGCGNCYFDGRVSQIKIYDYVRTDEQIMEEYQTIVQRSDKDTFQSEGMIGHWTFDEGTGTVAGNSGDYRSIIQGTLNNFSSPATGTSGWTMNGKIGRALLFDGINDVVGMGSDPDIDNMDVFTFSAWIYPTGWGESDFGRIIAKENNTTGLGFTLVNNAGQNSFRLYRERATTPAQATAANGTLSLNTWHHVVGMMDADQGIIRLYHNGEEVTYADQTMGSGTYNDDSAANLNVGNRSSTDRSFQGMIDDVRLYKTLLSNEQVKTLYNQNSSAVAGSTSTGSDGITVGNAALQEYCVPGDTSTCDAPVGEWKLDENTGSTFNDTSGNGFNLTTVNSPSWSQGKVGQAVQFNGSNQYAVYDDTTTNALDITSSYTLSGWVNFSQIGNDYQTIIAKFATNGSTSAYYMSTNGGDTNRDNEILCEMSSTSTTSFQLNPVLGTWYHTACVFDDAANTLTLYINGRQVAQTTGVTGSVTTGNGDLYIGGDPAGYGGYLNGRADNIRVYNYARTPAQIAWEYNRSAPVAHWKLDETSGTTAYDSSGNGLHATVYGDITFGDGRINNGAIYDGTDDLIYTADNPLLDLTTNATFMAWVYPTSNNDANIIQKDNANGYSFYIQPNLDQVCLYAHPDNKCASTPIDLNAWYHLTVVKNGSNLTFYKNGMEVGTATTVSSFQTNTELLGLGNRVFDLAGDYGGILDDVRIYNIPLTAVQVRTAMNDNAALRFAPLTGTP